MGFLVGLLVGIVASNMLLVLVSTVERQRVEQRANAVRKPDEVVECYNATVLIDENGRLGWIENDTDMPFVRREQIRSY